MKRNIEKEIGWLLKEKYDNKPTKSFNKDVKRLEAGEPVDYVIGFTEFLGCKIDLSKKTLIPRPDTEFWVEKVIEEIKKLEKKNIKCLDIFSGSGCIGTAILKNTKSLLCDFSDKDKKAIAQIKINCKLNKINPKRYQIIQSDIFNNISAKNKYDYIFANPPYVAVKRKSKVQKSVLKYEPKVALFSGSDGLNVIRKFLKLAKEYLNKDGKIFMEFGSEQKKEIEKLIKKYKYSKCKFYRDQYDKWRWVVVT
jgi:release factor glutamine methyltransferase